MDSNPIIYYTTNGGTPTTSSTKYTTPIIINKTTTLNFRAVDKAGNHGTVQTRKFYFSIQDAVNDASNQDTILVNSGTYIENILVNKLLTILPVSGANVIVQAKNTSYPIFIINSDGSGSTIQGFTIRGATQMPGIYLYQAIGCTLKGNTLTNNQAGILLQHSDYNTVTVNTMTGNSDGLFLQYAEYNLVSGNVIRNNRFAGIYISGSSNNTVSGNAVTENVEGILLDLSNNNTLTVNNITKNAFNGILLDTSNNNTLSGNDITSNYQDGISIGYSAKNSLSGNKVVNNNRGILLDSSINTKITENTVKGNQYGIYLYNADNNSIIDDIVTENIESGILIGNSNNNFLSGNIVTDNKDGIWIQEADYNIISENTVMNNGENGIVTGYSEGNTLSNNYVLNNSIAGIFLANSVNTEITGNVITGNQNGLLLTNSDSNIVSQNSVVNNLEDGILLINTNGTAIDYNDVIGNVLNGIYLSISNNNSLFGNNLVDNQGNGIVVSYSDGNFIIGNTAIENIFNGIVLDNSDNNIVSGNSGLNNQEKGILLIHSDNNTLSENDVKSNSDGIGLTYSDNNTIYGNNVIGNTHEGIVVDNSVNSEITGNTITGNRNGILLNFSPASVNFNRIFGNSFSGLYNQYSNYVDATNNWWGSNTPAVSSSKASDIFNSGGNVVYNPWIVLTVNTVYTANGIYNITADLTKNSQGDDISSLGHVPDGISVNFTTDHGTIGTIANTLNGKAISQLNSDTMYNIANITVSLDNQIVSTTVTVFKIYNTVTHKGFETIQAAIDDPSTSAGDTIEVASGTYVENILINKRIILISYGNTILRPANSLNPIITINSSGNGSIIQGFTIKGAAVGIYLDSVNDCSISENSIVDNTKGINLYNSENNLILDNIINGNSFHYGIYLVNSSNNIILNNAITNYIGINLLNGSNGNWILQNNILNSSNRGIGVEYSDNNIIVNNNITNNTYYGITLSWSNNTTIQGNIISDTREGIRVYISSANINFNIIMGNSLYGIYNGYDSFVNATNNWWGSNNGPTVSSTDSSDIYEFGGSITYNPWLVLNITASPTITKENSTITVDLTHNSNGEDISSDGYLRYGLPVNFTTSLGTITNVEYALAKTILTFNSGTITSGTANITVTLANHNVQISIIIDKVLPVVNASLASGLYNTTQSVDLTASDNLDPNPIIYYTLDGSTPTVSSVVYTGPISIGTTTTLKFMAVDSAGNQSPVTTEHYIFLTVANLNTGKGYSTIHDAIDDPLTVDGDIIVIKTGIYTENIILNKNLTLKPFSDGNVTIQAANSNNPVITINSGGSGSIILGFIVTGAIGTSSSGIYLNQASNCTIYSNNLTNNYYGLLLTNSANNTIFNNTLTSNLMEAIKLNNSDDNTIYSNIIINNSGNGIYLYNSQNTLIMANTIRNNSINGIELNNSSNTTVYQNIITDNQENGIKTTSSSADINFNVITGNSVHGLYSVGNGIINAENNWWGVNNPLVSSSSGSDIYIAGGTVTYDPWLVLSLTGSTITVTHNSTSDSDITADLTQNNQGDDTSSSGTIPDGLPVDFTTTLGTTNSTGTTKNGRSTVKLTSNTSDGATTVTATLNDQQVSKLFHKSFNSIQAAVSDPLTVDGDVILVTNGTYVENIVMNKNLTLISEGNVTIQALNPSIPTVTISNCSDVIFSGFTITGSGYLSVVYLSNVNNCYILDNVITGGGIDSAVAISTDSATNCTFAGNTLFNSIFGIGLRNSNNNTISGNNLTNNKLGVMLSGSNNILISSNTITGNSVTGINVNTCSSVVINGNTIENNSRGILLYYSSSIDVHFNRITGNGCGLVNVDTFCNATNNWWGTNNPVVAEDTPSDICIYDGTVLYDPWLVLTVTPTSYKVADGKVYEATITADLNHNNHGEYLSTLVHVPDGIPVNFTTDNGTITGMSYTIDGEASSTLVLDQNLQSGFTNITAIADGQSVSTLVDRTANAVIHIYSTAIDLSTGLPLELVYVLPLDGQVSWVSVLWRSTSPKFGTFQNEVDLIVNGEVVLSSTVTNPYYFYYKDYYSEKVFYTINFLNWLFSDSTYSKMSLQRIIETNPQLNNLTGSDLETALLNLIKLENEFTDDEIQFIANRKYFEDDIATYIKYPGDAFKRITFEDPDSGELVDINFPGNPISRISPMIYANGGYYHTYGDDPLNPTSVVYRDAGYEGVRSFAIVTTKVTDDILRYWLDEGNKTDGNGNLLYTNGSKAAYGTFLEALLVIYCHDMVADAAAYKYNVTWSRTTPIVVSVCDDTTSTYITGEMSHRMGMDVVGDPDNVKAFRFACSSSFSPIEHWVNEVLFPSYNSTSSLLGSVTLGLGYMLLNGEPLEIFESNGYIIIRAVGDNQRLLIIDPVTGIVRDGMTLNKTISGNYCFSDLQTEWATDFTENILNYGQNIRNILTNGNGIIDLGQLANNTKNGLIGFISSTMISLGITELFTNIQNDLTFTYNLYNNRDLAYRMLGACLMNARVAVRSDDAGDIMSPHTVYVEWVNEGKMITSSIRVNPNRALDAIELQIAIAALELGVISGVTEGIGIASALGFGVGLGGTVISVVRGKFNSIYEDPWLKVDINGKPVYAKRFVDLDPEIVDNYYLTYSN